MGNAINLGGLGGGLPSFVTKIDSGIYVPTEDIGRPTISHNLGEVPIGVLIYDADDPNETMVSECPFNFLFASAINTAKQSGYRSNISSVMWRDSSGYRSVGTTNLYAAYFGIYANRFEFDYNTVWYMRAGHHYNWMVFA